MLLFLDTEYTGYGQAIPQLISLALVAEDGKREFYVEIADTWRVADCTAFVKREVRRGWLAWIDARKLTPGKLG